MDRLRRYQHIRNLSSQFQHYHYETLKSELHIRLLKIEWRSKSGSTTSKRSPRFEIVETSEPPSYECLSYVWGNSDRSKKLRLVPDQGFIRITSSLLDAIYNVASEVRTGHIWIDQICVNQDDLKERGHQVRRMGSIYSGAVRTIVWLGPSIKGLSEAVEFTTQLHGRILAMIADQDPNTSMPLSKHQVRAINELLRRPWFRRGWVVQECALAKDVECLVGNTHLKLWHLHTINRCNSMFAGSPPILESMQSTAPNAVMSCVREYWTQRRVRETDIQELFRILQLCSRTFITTDPRDSVVAFLGLLPQLQYTPDLSLDLPDLLSHFARHVINASNSVEVLVYASGSSRLSMAEFSNLPSWVPHWKWGPDSVSMDDVVSFGAYALHTHPPQWWAAGKHGHQLSPGPFRSHQLCIRGRQVSNVTAVSATIEPTWITILSNKSSEERRRMTNISCTGEDLLRTIWEYSRTLSTQDMEFSKWINSASASFVNRTVHRIKAVVGMFVILTKHGKMGLASKPCRPGDQIVIVHGCSRPMILRPVRGEGQYEVISSCFVRGIMHGEAVDWTADEADEYVLI